MSEKTTEKPVRVQSLHGCLPLFVLLAAVVMGVGLWLLPVVKSSRLRPSGEGKIFYHTSGIINYEATRKSPLILPAHMVVNDLFYQDSRKMHGSIKRDAVLRKAPPMDILPVVPDSAVISREVLLELPPIPDSSPEQESASQGEPAMEQEVMP